MEWILLFFVRRFTSLAKAVAKRSGRARPALGQSFSLKRCKSLSLHGGNGVWSWNKSSRGWSNLLGSNPIRFGFPLRRVSRHLGPTCSNLLLVSMAAGLELGKGWLTWSQNDQVGLSHSHHAQYACGHWSGVKSVWPAPKARDRPAGTTSNQLLSGAGPSTKLKKIDGSCNGCYLGCGPALFIRMIEAMTDAGVGLGTYTRASLADGCTDLPRN